MRRADATLAIGDHFLLRSCAEPLEHLAQDGHRPETFGFRVKGLCPFQMHCTRYMAAPLGAHRIRSRPFAIPAHIDDQSFGISDRGLHVLRVGSIWRSAAD